MKNISYDYTEQPTWTICQSTIESSEYRKLVFLSHKSIFLYATNSRFGPTIGSFLLLKMEEETQYLSFPHVAESFVADLWPCELL